MMFKIINIKAINSAVFCIKTVNTKIVALTSVYVLLSVYLQLFPNGSLISSNIT